MCIIHHVCVLLVGVLPPCASSTTCVCCLLVGVSPPCASSTTCVCVVCWLEYYHTSFIHHVCVLLPFGVSLTPHKSMNTQICSRIFLLKLVEACKITPYRAASTSLRGRSTSRERRGRSHRRTCASRGRRACASTTAKRARCSTRTTTSPICGPTAGRERPTF